jgi:hypothetical protein
MGQLSTSNLKVKLAGLGLPVDSRKFQPSGQEETESLLADGCELARKDASVARVLPVLIYRLKDRLNYELLRKFCSRKNQIQAMGFFLELTAHLSGDSVLLAVAGRFRDRRITRVHDFFPITTETGRQLAELKTPKLAREWNWLMNMSIDSFRRPFRKFANAPLPEK